MSPAYLAPVRDWCARNNVKFVEQLAGEEATYLERLSGLSVLFNSEVDQAALEQTVFEQNARIHRALNSLDVAVLVPPPNPSLERLIYKYARACSGSGELHTQTNTASASPY